MTTNIQIRVCRSDDATALALVGQASFLETFAGILDGAAILAHCMTHHTPSTYSAWLTQDSARVWLAEVGPGNAPVGYLVLAPASLPIADPEADDLEIKRIYLLHRFQGTGLGKRLLLEALAYAKQTGCRRLLLGVYAYNKQAIGFYERMGFCKIGTRRFQVGDKDYDDQIMRLEITGGA